MKQLLMIIAVIGLAQAAKATIPSPENLALVKENLNTDIYSANKKIISFSISKNKDSARLQILSSICPQIAGGISCLAMPAVALNAHYTITHVETDACGIQTYTSNNVEVGNRLIADQRRFAQIVIKDYSLSICEMVYPADVQVDLQDTTVDVQSDQAQVHYSTMFFNYTKVTGPVNQ